MLLLLLFICIVFLIVSTTRFKLHPFLALLISALLFGMISGMPVETILQSINEGFGNTLGSIGLVIILGVIIGAFLEQSGGAYALANAVLRILGKRRVPLTMTLIGYIVSIPVFADSGFIILDPLNKALTKKAKLSLSVTAIALAIGLLASHAMVPPTPGPIAAAGIIGADLGLVILWGLVVSSLAMVIPLFFVYKVAPKYKIEANPEISEEDIEDKMKSAPSAGRSLLPIVVPILLIVAKSVNDYMSLVESSVLYDVITFLGTPVIALLIGLGLALLLPKKLEKQMLSPSGWTGKALRDAAIIIMITGAGGIFGKVLQNSELPSLLEDNLGSMQLGIWLPFIIAAALKTAQGSSTVAMITTASIVAPMTAILGFDSDLALVLCVLAIGAGSLVVSHAPDSFFWVVTQMTKMEVSTGYKLHTVVSGILGISAAVIIWIIWMIWV